MTEDQRYKITSPDFADLILEYNGDMDLFENYPNSSYNIVNNNYAILHLPKENITPDSITRFGYFNFPTCFGLLSAQEPPSFQIRKIPTPFNTDLKGEGVLVGFIDTGIDYKNQVFRNKENTTRIVSIWDQTIESQSAYPGDIYYGSEYNQEQINLALKSDNPLSIVPSMDEIGHGTMLAGITAGTPIAMYEFSGMAPEAEFVIVKLKQAKPYLREFYGIPEDAVCFQENDIIMGIKYLDEIAIRLNKPLVICLGIGTSQSDHAGTRITSRYLSMLSEYPGRTVIVAAGNEGNRGSHYYGDISPPSTFEDVALNVGVKETGFSLQFWGTSPNLFWIDLFTPTGEFLSRVPPSIAKTIILTYENSTIIVDSQIKDPYINEQLIVLRFLNPIPGTWRFFVYGATGDLPMKFHFWLPIHNFIEKDTLFLKPDTYTTITSPGNSMGLICTTAYNPINLTLFYYASKGFNVMNYPKPDIAAPGVEILAPYLDNQFVESSGTSIASAYTAGVAAMLMEWGITKGNLTSINTLLIRKVFTQSANRKPDLNYPNPEWGYGILDIHNINRVLNELLEINELH